MAKGLHSGHRARLRQNMLNNGMDNMQQHQVLEYLLSFVIARKDTNPIAHNLIDTFGDICGVLEAPVEELKQIDGVGEVAATFLHSFLQFSNYYNKARGKRITYVINSASTVILAKSLFAGKQKEEMYAVLIDDFNKVLGTKKLADGTKSYVNVCIRDITRYALMYNAKKVLICHNHPDSNSTPSAEDVAFTEQLKIALKPNQLEVKDHIIVGLDGCYSFNADMYISDDMVEEFLENSTYRGRP